MAGESLQIVDLRVDVNRLAEEGNVLCSLHQKLAQSAFGLVAYEDDAGPGVPQVVFQVMADAPRVAHAAGGNDDLRRLVHVQALGFGRGPGKPQILEIQRVVAFQNIFLGLLVKDLRVLSEHLRSRGGHRAVHVDHQLVQLVLVLTVFLIEFVELEDQFLGSAYGKGRDHHGARLFWWSSARYPEAP